MNIDLTNSLRLAYSVSEYYALIIFLKLVKLLNEVHIFQIEIISKI